MNLIQKLKNKLASKHSFKKNELADMGAGKITKAEKAPAKKATKGKK